MRPRRPVAAAVFRCSRERPVEVVVAEVPGLVRADQLPAPTARDHLQGRPASSSAHDQHDEPARSLEPPSSATFWACSRSPPPIGGRYPRRLGGRGWPAFRRARGSPSWGHARISPRGSVWLERVRRGGAHPDRACGRIKRGEELPCRLLNAGKPSGSATKRNSSRTR